MSIHCVRPVNLNQINWVKQTAGAVSNCSNISPCHQFDFQIWYLWSHLNLVFVCFWKYDTTAPFLLINFWGYLTPMSYGKSIDSSLWQIVEYESDQSGCLELRNILDESPGLSPPSALFQWLGVWICICHGSWQKQNWVQKKQRQRVESRDNGNTACFIHHLKSLQHCAEELHEYSDNPSLWRRSTWPPI